MSPNRNKLPSVAMLGHKRIPSREGGIEIVVEELSTRMSALGYNLTCYNRKGHHVSGVNFDTATSGEFKGVKLKNVFTIDKKGLAAVTASFFAAVRAAFGKYDVVHFHAEGPCAMLWLPKLFGKRCIATIHGLDFQRNKWGKFASFYIRSGEKCAVKYADEIIVLSRNVKNYFFDTYGRETVYIPNGVTRPEIRKCNKIFESFGLKENDYILFLGRLVPEKGLTDLIKAFKNCKTAKKLVIAGGSSDAVDFEKELKDLATEDDRIIFTDFVQGEILEELLSNAYFYVLPSFLEGMPLSLLEAMSYGNCCLTSDIPECAEVIDDYGLTFKKGDIDDLRAKMQYLLDSEVSVEHFKEIAADYICKKFNWDKVVAETLQLYGFNTAVVSSDSEDVKDESVNCK